ncbi:SDR family oxidoreductase [Sorangium sp. So ce295]|uniref:SDR family NAD(P)-dependent oxidoreductase n=1 Tax=Sorangium sp. So ce295 TaxID=3133295 RepID=UPI003F601D28
MSNVLVTGGSGGIGQAVVQGLRVRGHRVAVADRNQPQEADCYVQCDLSETEGAGSLIASVRTALGSIDSLVLCAARYDASTLDGCTVDSFASVLRMNLVSPFALVRAWLDPSAEDPRGVVVLVGSAAGHIGSRDPGYSASKAGILGLTRSLALNLTGRGPSVFSVSPGIVDTAMSRAQPEERREMAISRTMLKRAARPEEVAAAILWLVETRPHYMSGADLNVSNGLTW